MTLDGTAGSFDNNEIWAGAPGQGNYVEFGHTLNTVPGVPPSHWFWARTVNGVQQGFELNRAYSHLTAYNATIKWTGSSGAWQYWQGGTQIGSGGGSAPVGPIVNPIMGAEIGAGTLTQQDSIYSYNAGRVQSGVSYPNWANPGRTNHDVPPFDTSGSFGNTWIDDENPSVGGALGC